MESNNLARANGIPRLSITLCSNHLEFGKINHVHSTRLLLDKWTSLERIFFIIVQFADGCRHVYTVSKSWSQLKKNWCPRTKDLKYRRELDSSLFSNARIGYATLNSQPLLICVHPLVIARVAKDQ